MRALDVVGTLGAGVGVGVAAEVVAGAPEVGEVELADVPPLVQADARANTSTGMASNLGRMWSIFPDRRDLQQMVRPKERFRHSRDVLAVQNDLPDQTGHDVRGEGGA